MIPGNVTFPVALALDLEAVHTRFSDRFTQSEALQTEVDRRWSEATALRPTLFDGELARLLGVELDEAGISLGFERTRFSTYLATRAAEFTDSYPEALRANPLGLTGILLTADDHVFVSRRSLTAEQNPGAIYFVGGYAEPPAKGCSLDIFAEIRREVLEETGVELVKSDLTLIGIGYDPENCHPEAFFIARTDLLAEAVAEGLFGKRQ